MNKIPVVLISGFLGSGKTTLLLRLLEFAAKRQWRTAVLMNEMGEQDVDGDTVSGQIPDLPIEKLLDGCICCTRRDELGQALQTLLDQKPDLIFIETTGVANPEQILEDLQDPSLADRISIQRKIALADCGKFLEYNSFFASSRGLVRTLRGQISFADMIILNKAGGCDVKQINKVMSSIRKINTTASMAVTDYSRLDENEVFSTLQLQLEPSKDPSHSFPTSQGKPGNPADRTQDKPLTDDHSKHAHHQPERSVNDHHSHLHGEESGHSSTSFTGLDTLTLSAPSPFPLQLSVIETFLAALGSSLIRAKGYIHLSTGPSLVQWAGSELECKPSTLQLQRGYLTLIGHRLDKNRMVQEWEGLLSGVVQ